MIYIDNALLTEYWDWMLENSNLIYSLVSLIISEEI